MAYIDFGRRREGAFEATGVMERRAASLDVWRLGGDASNGSPRSVGPPTLVEIDVSSVIIRLYSSIYQGKVNNKKH
jgi:hypothetical protein